MSIATKLGRNVTYYKGLWLFNHVVLGDYVTDYKRLYYNVWNYQT